MSTADVTGPLAPLFAQVREGLARVVCTCESGAEDGGVNTYYDESLAALSSIERHVQDMEKALDFIARRRIALEAFGLGNIADVADAALPASGTRNRVAREKGTECPAGHGSQCCGYPDECREALKEQT